jgi:type II secretory pathway pseudopilin PulG
MITLPTAHLCVTAPVMERGARVVKTVCEGRLRRKIDSQTGCQSGVVRKTTSRATSHKETTQMTIRNRKPLIALIVAAGSVLAIPAMAQTAQQSAAQAQTQAAQAQQSAAQADQAADAATGAATQASAQAGGGGGGGQTWASVDTDGDGAISKTEAQVNAGLAQVFDQADSNKDGKLTPDEYKAYVAAQQGAAAGGNAAPGR